MRASTDKKTVRSVKIIHSIRDAWYVGFGSNVADDDHQSSGVSRLYKYIDVFPTPFVFRVP